MFWTYNNTTSSQIETLLCKEDVTLREVMDEENVINECKVQNKVLVEFLMKPEILEELVTLTVVEPSPDLDERIRFKYPNIACELLTCDLAAINERIASDEALLAKLYAFVDCEPPLHPLLASFFSKIMGVLIAKQTVQVLDFLKAKENFIDLLLKHLGTSAIMDLILKLMTQVEGVEMRQNILNWLDSQRIIQSLVALMDPNNENEKHYNVAQLLCDFIKIARDNQRNSAERNDPDPLLNTLESPEMVSALLDNILGEVKSESAIVGGIQILLGLLDVNRNCIPKYDSQNVYNSGAYDDVDVEHRQKVVQSTMQEIVKRLKNFNNLLLDPPKQNAITTTAGDINPPLGNTRLHVVKLLACLISANNTEFIDELIALGTMQVLLDLFFQYPWNNFLHTQVEVCVTSALKINIVPEWESDSNALCKHLLVQCRLIDRILEAWKENDKQQAQEKGVRQGYMGHLISMLNKIVSMCSSSSLGQLLKENMREVFDALEAFKESTLQEINKTQETLLGGVNPNSSTEGSDEYGEMPFSQSGLNMIHQQVYTQYQMQHLAPQFIQTYGFHDDDFNDGDDTVQTIDSRTNMNFDLSEGDLIQQQELFKQVCEQNINTLDDDEDQIFEDRGDHTYQTVIEKRSKRHDAEYGSDSDDSPTSRDPLMDVDPWSSPTKASEAPTEDPWASFPTKLGGGETGWADFDSATFSSFEGSSEHFDKKINGLSDKAAELIVEKDLKMESVDIGGDNPSGSTQGSDIPLESKPAKSLEEIDQLEGAPNADNKKSVNRGDIATTGKASNEIANLPDSGDIKGDDLTNREDSQGKSRGEDVHEKEHKKTDESEKGQSCEEPRVKGHNEDARKNEEQRISEDSGSKKQSTLSEAQDLVTKPSGSPIKVKSESPRKNQGSPANKKSPKRGESPRKGVQSGQSSKEEEVEMGETGDQGATNIESSACDKNFTDGEAVGARVELFETQGSERTEGA